MLFEGRGPERRAFLLRAGIVAGAMLTPSLFSVAMQQAVTPEHKDSDKKSEEGEQVTPTEDLMREHGLLRRVLLVYDELIHRLDTKQQLEPSLVAASAGIVKRFVEAYHEKQEEDYVFPRLQKAGKEVDLVTVLLQQHAAGRVVTARVEALAAGSLKSEDARLQLKGLLQSFARMYRPHAAREDTVLFPAFRSVVSQNEYDSLGEQFEKNETRMFGEGGFEKFVADVARIERELGIYDLRQFTPKVS